MTRAAITSGVAAALLSGCGGAPVLSDLRCAEGEQACQAEGSPHTLELEVDFEDEDGDLGAGVLFVLIDGRRQASLDGGELFEKNALPPGATSGTLRFRLDLALSTREPGATFEVGVEAEDGAGHLSNDPSIEFEVTP